MLDKTKRYLVVKPLPINGTNYNSINKKFNTLYPLGSVIWLDEQDRAEGYITLLDKEIEACLKKLNTW